MAGSRISTKAWTGADERADDRALRDPRAVARGRHPLHLRQPGDGGAGLPRRARQLPRPALHPDPPGDDRGRDRATATPGRDIGRRSSSSTAGSASATASGCSTRRSAAARPLVVIAGESGVGYEAIDAQMAADLVSIASPVTKWATTGHRSVVGAAGPAARHQDRRHGPDRAGLRGPAGGRARRAQHGADRAVVDAGDAVASRRPRSWRRRRRCWPAPNVPSSSWATASRCRVPRPS